MFLLRTTHSLVHSLTAWTFHTQMLGDLLGREPASQRGFLFYLIARRAEGRFAHGRCCLARAPNERGSQGCVSAQAPTAQTRPLRMGVAIAKVRQPNTSSETLARSINVGVPTRRTAGRSSNLLA